MLIVLCSERSFLPSTIVTNIPPLIFFDKDEMADYVCVSGNNNLLKETSMWPFLLALDSFATNEMVAHVNLSFDKERKTYNFSSNLNPQLQITNMPFDKDSEGFPVFIRGREKNYLLLTTAPYKKFDNELRYRDYFIELMQNTIDSLDKESKRLALLRDSADVKKNILSDFLKET